MPRLPWVVGLLGLAILTLTCVMLNAPRIESSLTTQAREALSVAGLSSSASVVVEGRDAILRVREGASFAEAANAVMAVEGVRAVRAWEDGSTASPDDTTAVAAPPDAPAEAPPASFALASLPDGGLVARGTVADADARAALMARLRAALPEADIADSLAIAAGAPDDWQAPLAAALPALADVDGPGLELDGDGPLTVRGTVGSADARDAVVERVRRAVAPREVRDALRIDAPAPPAARPDTATARPAPAPAPSVRPGGAPTEVQNAKPDDEQMARAARELEAAVRVGAIQFESGSTQLTPRSTGVLDRAAAVLKQYPDIDIELQAHTDAEGPTASNQKLSERRAVAAKRYLVGQGVAASQLYAAGYGESTPVASDATEAGRSRNRRVVFKLLRR